jgi:hypothetical protein
MPKSRLLLISSVTFSEGGTSMETLDTDNRRPRDRNPRGPKRTSQFQSWRNNFLQRRTGTDHSWDVLRGHESSGVGVCRSADVGLAHGH